MFAVVGMRSNAQGERERAWRDFYERYGDAVLRMVLQSGVNPAEVEDIAQRVFIVVHRRIQDEDVRKVRPWLRGIVLRVVQEHRRWRRVREAKAWFTELMERDREERLPTPERNAEQQEAMRTVWEVLDGMPAKLREAIVLCDLQECPPREAAEVLGIPVNTVRSRRRLAKEDFTRRLERRERRRRG